MVIFRFRKAGREERIIVRELFLRKIMVILNFGYLAVGKPYAAQGGEPDFKTCGQGTYPQSCGVQQHQPGL